MRKIREWTQRIGTRPEPKRLIRIVGDDYNTSFDLVAEFLPRESGVGTSLCIQTRKGDSLDMPELWPKVEKWKYVDSAAVSAPVPVLAEAVEA